MLSDILIDKVDGSARKDVMELLEQGQLPHPFDLLERIRGAGGEVGEGAKVLEVAEEDLAAPVVLLDGGLGGEGAAVQLKVELADPLEGVADLGLELLEKLLRGALLELGDAVEVGETGGALEHLRRGPAAAVAKAKEHVAVGAAVAVAVAGGAADDLVNGDPADVGVGGGEVDEDLGAVKALPDEGV